MRVLYDSNALLLITKFVAGVPHEVAATLFWGMVLGKIASVGLPFYSLTDLLAARFGIPGGRSKEAVEALRPDTRNLRHIGHPLLLKLGFRSRSRDSAQRHASGWPILGAKLAL